MGYFTDGELSKMGFKHYGKNVKISDKASIYNCDMISIGDNSRIDDFAVLSGNISIGRNVHITCHCMLNGTNDGIILGDFSTLAYGVKIFTATDDYTEGTMTNSTIPYKYKKVEEKPVELKKHVIVGTNSVILPGVILSEGTSIGACSLVKNNTEKCGIYFGVPAKLSKMRGSAFINLEKEYLETYEK